MHSQSCVPIVLADELGLVREGLACLCEASGQYKVVGQCGDGQTALEMIQALQPDIALLDLNLPGLFTLELVHKVRNLGLDARTVVLSTRRDRKTVIEVLRAGASAFLLKAGTSGQLMEALRQVRNGGIYISPLLELEKIFLNGRNGEQQNPLESLSTREYQVFSLLIDGIRAKEIAARLDLSPKTVDTYRASLMRKLDIHDVAGLVKFAITNHLTTAA